MNKQEYKIVKNFSYEEYCDYLSKKYESADKTGLFKHHTFENVKANLSNPDIAKDATEEERNTITYCSFDEHLFLHILIGEQTDARKALGLGGAVTYIIPQLNKYFDRGEMVYSSNYYSNLDKDVFDILVKRCNEAIAKTSIALDHNKSIYLQAEKYLEESGKALVVIGTGLGKTTTALEYLWEHKCRALVIGPNNIIKSGWEEYTDWCDTTTYQAFANNYSTIDYSQYGLVILDEAHHAGYDQDTGKGAAVWSKGIIYIIERGVKVLGLTATPERSDKIDIGNTIFKGCVCEGFAVEDGIEKGIIHPFSYVTAYYDTNGIAEEYSDCENKELVGQLDLAINNTPTVKDIFRKHMPNNKRKGIVFIQEIADEQNVIDIMKDVYPNVEMKIIHSKMTDEEVKANRKWFEETDEGYLLAVNMISEGAHYRGVNTLIMFRRTNSYLVFTQQIGRIITLVKNENTNAIVFDLVNNIENVQYGNNNTELKNKHSISKIIKVLKKSEAFKSNQIIVADETRDIVKAIRDIKQFGDDSWEDWEIEILKTYYEKHGAKYCADKINIKWKIKKRTKYAVFKKAYNLKLSYKDPIYNNYFSESELNFLLDNYHKGLAFCASKLQNRSKQSISRALRRFNLSFPSDIIFTDEIKEMLKNPDKSNEDISKETEITVDKIRQKRINMGIINPKFRHKKWTKDEDNIIISFYPIEGGKCYSKLINRTEEDVRRRAKALHIKSNARYNTIKKSILCIETGEIFNSIKEASNKISRRPNSLTPALKDQNKTAGGYHWKYVED